MKERIKNVSSSRGGGDAVYGLGLIGAIIYYFQQATSFWMVLVGLFKAFFWPAFLVYAMLTNLKM